MSELSDQVRDHFKPRGELYELRHRLARMMNKEEWDKYRSVSKNFADQRRYTERAFELDYPSRFDQVRQRLIDEAGSAKRRFVPKFIGADNFDKSEINRRAQNQVRKAMTGAWSKGKYRHYAYYRCQTRSCENKGKSTPVAKIEEGFANILKGMQPAKEMFDLANAMLRDAWNMRLALALNEKDALEKQLGDVNCQLENMLDRIVEANSTSVVSAYETRIEKLERDKLVLNDKIAKSIQPKGRLEDCIEFSLKFLSSPWNIWKKVDFSMRQAVLRLAFAEPLRCSQNGVYETPKFSFPFKC